MTLAAEFPNDNPDLHEGTIWVCLDVTGMPVAERRRVEVELEVEVVAEAPPRCAESGIFMIDSFSSLADDEDDDEEEEDEPIVVEELAPLEDIVEVVEVVEEAAAVAPLETLASVETIAPLAPSAAEPDDPYMVLVSTLVDVAIAQGATVAASEIPAMLANDNIAQGWAAILRGTSEDWDAIGGTMLDEWAADALARLVGADAQMLKRELRARGIAAFGLAA